MAKTEDAAIHHDISRRLVVLTLDVVPSATGKVMPSHAPREQKAHHDEQDDEDTGDNANLRRSLAFLEVGFSLCIRIHGILLFSSSQTFVTHLLHTALRPSRHLPRS
jgi:hypothetical protein